MGLAVSRVMGELCSAEFSAIFPDRREASRKWVYSHLRNECFALVFDQPIIQVCFPYETGAEMLNWCCFAVTCPVTPTSKGEARAI